LTSFVRHIRQLAEKAGGDWDPLGEDCGSNKSNLTEAKNIYFKVKKDFASVP